MSLSPVAQSLLLLIRQHEGLPELIASIECPRIKRYRPGQADQIEKARADWIYQSGQVDQHQRWLAALTGKTEEL